MDNEPEPKIRCRYCGSDDIMVQVSCMIPANEPLIAETVIRDLTEDDYYFCNSCEDDCRVKVE